MNMQSNLNNISILFFSFVAIIVVINLFTTNNYGRANARVVEMMEQENYLLNYYQLHHVLTEDADNYLLIDLRDEAAFSEGHLPRAINIPMEELLERSSIRTISRTGGKTAVLYGGSESAAHSARYLLLSKGVDNTMKVMAGDYDKALEYVAKKFQPSYAAYKDEKAQFDYRRFMQMSPGAQGTRQSTPAGVIPAVSQETLSAQGGC